MRKRRNKIKRKVFILLGGFLIVVALFFLSGREGKYKEKDITKSNLNIMSGASDKKTETEKELKNYQDVPMVAKKPRQAPNMNMRGYYKKLYKNKKAYSIVDISNAENKQIKAMFYSTKITKKIFKRIYGKSYKENCTVPKSDLRYVRVLHYGFDENVHIGELITNKAIAEDVCNIFYRLFRARYQIEKMLLVDEYNADDNLSMADNNTSCFNFRFVSGTKRLSNHSYGLAIDINPLYNPYIHTINNVTVCEPENGKNYQNRKKDFEHKIESGDLCYKIFKRYGFLWGGEWINSKDYQHFQYEL